MGLRETGKKVAHTATLALATTGLSSCIGCGADPIPTPIVCSDYQAGIQLQPTVSWAADQLSITMPLPAYEANEWKDATVTDLGGATLVYANGAGTFASFTLQLPPGTTSGTFRFSGTMFAYGRADCAVSRVFTFQVVVPDAGNATVQISERTPLPLEARDQATIAVLEDEGDEVWVEARTTFAGPWSPRWDVSAGEILEVRGSRMRWRVPPGAGLHQVELVVDYGERGLSFDSLSLERG